MKENWKKCWARIKHVVELEDTEPFVLSRREVFPVKLVAVHEFNDNCHKESRCWIIVAQKTPTGMVTEWKWKIFPHELPGGVLSPKLQDVLDRSFEKASEAIA